MAEVLIPIPSWKRELGTCTPIIHFYGYTYNGVILDSNRKSPNLARSPFYYSSEEARQLVVRPFTSDPTPFNMPEEIAGWSLDPSNEVEPRRTEMGEKGPRDIPYEPTAARDYRFHQWSLVPISWVIPSTAFIFRHGAKWRLPRAVP